MARSLHRAVPLGRAMSSVATATAVCYCSPLFPRSTLASYLIKAADPELVLLECRVGSNNLASGRHRLDGSDDQKMFKGIEDNDLSLVDYLNIMQVDKKLIMWVEWFQK